MIKITFPDGSVREYEQGVTGLQIAESISPALARLFCADGNDHRRQKQSPGAHFLRMAPQDLISAVVLTGTMQVSGIVEAQTGAWICFSC